MDLVTRLSCGLRDEAPMWTWRRGSHVDMETRLPYGPRDKALTWTHTWRPHGPTLGDQVNIVARVCRTTNL